MKKAQPTRYHGLEDFANRAPKDLKIVKATIVYPNGTQAIITKGMTGPRPTAARKAAKSEKAKP